jgi:MoaA/NifB/PqqE/SkfB family radical SAM enzyme
MAEPRWSVGINFDSKCNARCAHCCVSSSPDATANLDDDLVDSIIDDLLREPNVREVGLTGGEPLIRRSRTMSIIARVTASGRIAACVTNGFWGVSRRAADRALEEFEEAGLRELTLSYDDFHSPYIKPERIRNILDAAHDRRIKVALNMNSARACTASRSRSSRSCLPERRDRCRKLTSIGGRSRVGCCTAPVTR